MLARTFRTPIELGLTIEQYNALMLVLDNLESGELPHALFDDDGYVTGGFNMRTWWLESKCGSIGCIAGWAWHLGGGCFLDPDHQFPTLMCDALIDLFYARDRRCTSIRNITPAQAARALRNYLETGQSRWEEVA